MRDFIMVDRSRWDQSFIDVETKTADGRRSGDVMDIVFGLNDDLPSNWLTTDSVLRAGLKNTSLTKNGVKSMVYLNGGRSSDDIINCPRDDDQLTWNDPTSGEKSCDGTLSRKLPTTPDDRVYQNGGLVFEGRENSTWVPDLDNLSTASSCVSPKRSASVTVLGNQPDLTVTFHHEPTSPSSPFAAEAACDLDSSQSVRNSSSSPMMNDHSSSNGSGGSDCSTSVSQKSVDRLVADRNSGPANGSSSECSSRSDSGPMVRSAYSRVASFLPAWDLERLEAVYSRLATSGFYFGQMTIDEAAERLSRWPVGSFLLRDSSDPRYLFSVSIQTCRGTTSIRMAYHAGLFRLDCSSDQEHLMPTFDCAVRLLSHYVRLCAAGNGAGGRTSSKGRNGHSYVLLESSGRRDTPVLLRTPYRDRAPTLAHLCRTTVHQSLTKGGCTDTSRDAAVDRLHLIPSLKKYLKDYPYDL